MAITTETLIVLLLIVVLEGLALGVLSIVLDHNEDD
jgi:hypothetical protein